MQWCKKSVRFLTSTVSGLALTTHSPMETLERRHRVWNDIASQSMQDPRSWDEMIPSALLALRTAIHETSQHSLYYLMTGRDPMLPLGTLLRPRARYMGEEPHKNILENHHKAMVKVLQNSKEAFERSKRHHDRKVKDNDLKVGDLYTCLIQLEHQN